MQWDYISTLRGLQGQSKEEKQKMDWKEYLMDVLWPLLNDEQKERLAKIAEDLAQLAPPNKTEDTENE